MKSRYRFHSLKPGFLWILKPGNLTTKSLLAVRLNPLLQVLHASLSHHFESSRVVRLIEIEAKAND